MAVAFFVDKIRPFQEGEPYLSMCGHDTKYYVCMLGTVFDEILTYNYLEIAFIFGLQTLQSIDLGRIYCLKGLEPKNKGYFQKDGC